MNSGRLAAFRNKSIGFVFQVYHLIGGLRAADNVELIPSTHESIKIPRNTAIIPCPWVCIENLFCQTHIPTKSRACGDIFSCIDPQLLLRHENYKK